ncbi:hypothetical protein [Streptomyces sp. NBC_00306]|uniref:hypothetical protein n=1 Tax=Streptomyces sp. NBC_00306 TaxID=2975708 RepID=UPI002E2B87FC|nr:hypothetical protein [Streptomyces sp. NBC_00306]
MFAGLLDASHLMPLDTLPDTAVEYARAAGFTGLLIYVADLNRQGLHLLTGPNGAAPGTETDIRVEGTVPGRAYQYGRLTSAAPQEAGGTAWWVPLVDGTERLGLLRVQSTYDDARALMILRKTMGIALGHPGRNAPLGRGSVVALVA